MQGAARTSTRQSRGVTSSASATNTARCGSSIPPARWMNTGHDGRDDRGRHQPPGRRPGQHRAAQAEPAAARGGQDRRRSSGPSAAARAARPSGRCAIIGASVRRRHSASQGPRPRGSIAHASSPGLACPLASAHTSAAVERGRRPRHYTGRRGTWRNGRRGGLKHRWGEGPVGVRIPPSPLALRAPAASGDSRDEGAGRGGPARGARRRPGPRGPRDRRSARPTGRCPHRAPHRRARGAHRDGSTAARSRPRLRARAAAATERAAHRRPATRSTPLRRHGHPRATRCPTTVRRGAPSGRVTLATASAPRAPHGRRRGLGPPGSGPAPRPAHAVGRTRRQRRRPRRRTGPARRRTVAADGGPPGARRADATRGFVRRRASEVVVAGMRSGTGGLIVRERIGDVHVDRPDAACVGRSARRGMGGLRP